MKINSKYAKQSGLSRFKNWFPRSIKSCLNVAMLSASGLGLALSPLSHATYTYDPTVKAPAGFKFGIWNWDASLLGDDERINDMINFALENGITEISFSVNWSELFDSNPINLTHLEELIERVKDNNIEIDLLMGSPSWIFHPDASAISGEPTGGSGFEYGVNSIEYFMEYQNSRYNAALPGACNTCFDGIRLDVEPHVIRAQVLNSDLTAGDPRLAEPASNPDGVALWGETNPRQFNGEDLVYQYWDPNGTTEIDGTNWDGELKDSSYAVRGEILKRFYKAMTEFKKLLHDDRGAGHITNSSTAKADYLSFAADHAVWYNTIKDAQNNRPMVDTDGNGTEDKEAWKAVLDIPDRIGLMGYSDSFALYKNNNSTILAYLNSVYNDSSSPFHQVKRVSPGIETIDGDALGFVDAEIITLAGDPYAQMRNLIENIITDLLVSYPVIEGIRYHEFAQRKPDKSWAHGPLFNAMVEWVEAEVTNNSNTADWEFFHNVPSTITPVLPTLANVPSVSAATADALSLSITNFKPSDALSGSLTATINGLPTGTAAGDFEVNLYKHILGDGDYLDGGTLFDLDGRDLTDLTPTEETDNGILNATGNFKLGPVRFSNGTRSTAFVWFLDVHNKNGAFIRRFVLDPMVYCTSPGIPAGCFDIASLPYSRFFDPDDPSDATDSFTPHTDVASYLPTENTLVFSNITMGGEATQSHGANQGTVTGTISNFPVGTGPEDYVVFYWAEHMHGGADDNTTNPNIDPELNTWSLLNYGGLLNASGDFSIANRRPINLTGDSSDPIHSRINGRYKLWLTVHERSELRYRTNRFPRLGCPTQRRKAIKVSMPLWTDDFLGLRQHPSYVDTYQLQATQEADINIDVHFLSVDDAGKSGIISGNVTGLDASKNYRAYVWAEGYDNDNGGDVNIWQERAKPVSNIDLSKGGYFEVGVTGINLYDDIPRNIWVSVQEEINGTTLNLNEFKHIHEKRIGTKADGTTAEVWNCHKGTVPDDPSTVDPAVDLTGPLWMGRYFHMDGTFVYYEGFRPARQAGSRDTTAMASGDTPSNLTATPGHDSMILTWQDNSSKEVRFDVHQYDPGVGSWAIIASVAGSDGTGGTKTWKVEGLNPSTNYQYQVRATNLDAAGTPQYSSWTAKTYVSTLAAPATSTNVYARVVNYIDKPVGPDVIDVEIINMPASGDYIVQSWIDAPGDAVYAASFSRKVNAANADKVLLNTKFDTSGANLLYITMNLASDPNNTAITEGKAFSDPANLPDEYDNADYKFRLDTVNVEVVDHTTNPIYFTLNNLPMIASGEYYAQVWIDLRGANDSLYAGNYMTIDADNSKDLNLVHYYNSGDVYITLHPKSDTAYSPGSGSATWWQFNPGEVYENGFPGFDDADYKWKVNP